MHSRDRSMFVMLRTIFAVIAVLLLCACAARSQQALAPGSNPTSGHTATAASSPPSMDSAAAPPAQTVPVPSAGSPPSVVGPIRARIAAVAHAPIIISRPASDFDSMSIDPGMRRIMAGHSATGRFAVLNLADHTVRDLPTGPVRGIAVDVDLDKVFVADADQKVIVFDRKSLVRIDSIDLGGHADALALDSDDHRLFVDHQGSPDLWVIDAKTHQTLGSIRLDGNPCDIVYDAGAKRILQTVASPDRLEEIDPDSVTVTGSWPTAPATAPRGVAVDAEGHFAFVAGSNGTLVVMDTQTGAVLSSTDIAQNVDQVAYDPELSEVFCASGTEGVVTVVQVAPSGAAATVGDMPTDSGANSLTLSRTGPDLDVWVSYAATYGSYMQCFSLTR